MNIRYTDNGIFFVNSLGFAEWVDESKIMNVKKIKIRDYWENNFNDGK